MADFGEKAKARAIVQQAGVPVVPGTDDTVDSPDEVRAFADDHGYPVAIKADGGGGRGPKIVIGLAGSIGNLYLFPEYSPILVWPVAIPVLVVVSLWSYEEGEGYATERTVITE
ncbi:MAG: hypothetical protein IH933_00455 [Euryarchaeota archaeon]|nr:hypothetical protein [Euryarchaeota archaeon]